MARTAIKFSTRTRIYIYDPVEQIEADLSAADRAKLDALGSVVTRA